MEDVKNLLTVTMMVMAAGSSIYTIKTYMKPGMDLNINLEESAQLEELHGNFSEFVTTPTDNFSSFIADFPLDVGNNTSVTFESIGDSAVDNKS